MALKLCIATLFFILNVSISIAATKINGMLQSEFRAESFSQGGASHSPRFLLISSKEDMKAEISASFNTDDETTTLIKALLTKSLPEKGSRWIVGIDRILFGSEQSADPFSYSTIDRSLLARRMEILGFAGRQTQLRYEMNSLFPNADQWKLSLAHSANQNTNLLIGYHEQLAKSLYFHNWLIIQSDHTDTGQQIVGAHSLSIEYGSNEELHFQWELNSGIDPLATELKRLTDKNDKVYFWGSKLHLAQKQGIDHDEWWQWMLQISGLVHDAHNPKFNSLAALIGLNYGDTNMRIAANIELIGSTSADQPDTRHYSESQAKAQLLYTF